MLGVLRVKKMKNIILSICFFSCFFMLQLDACSCNGCCSCKSSSKKSCSCGSSNCSGSCSSRGQSSNNSLPVRSSSKAFSADDFAFEKKEEKEDKIDETISEVYKRLQNQALVDSGDVVVQGDEDKPESEIKG